MTVAIGCAVMASVWVGVGSWPAGASRTTDPVTANRHHAGYRQAVVEAPVRVPVTVIGDSLVWQSKNAIIHAFEDSGYSGYLLSVYDDPGHAMSSPWAQTEIASTLVSRARIIVIETASNDLVRARGGVVSLAVWQGLADSLLDRAGPDRCIVFVNAKQSAALYYPTALARQFDSLMTAVVGAHANARLADWAAVADGNPGWFAPDGLHFAPGLPPVAESQLASLASPPYSLTTTGMAAFGRTIASAVASC